jgi:hypothetical protein
LNSIWMTVCTKFLYIGWQLQEDLFK